MFALFYFIEIDKLILFCGFAETYVNLARMGFIFFKFQIQCGFKISIKSKIPGQLFD